MDKQSYYIFKYFLFFTYKSSHTWYYISFMEKYKLVDINSHTWRVQYVDGSADFEGDRKWHELNFPIVERLILVPNPGSERKTIVIVEKDPDYILIFRKTQYFRGLGNPIHLGTEYMFGLESDDGSVRNQQVECGWRDPSELSRQPTGFRAWLLRDGTMRYAGCLSIREDLVGEMKIITLSIL